METEVQITLIFLGAGLLAYVIIPGLLDFRTKSEEERPSGFAFWDRVLDHMESGTEEQKK